MIVLAAGEGTRMHSPNRPKVMHDFAGRSIIGHVLASAEGLRAQQTVVVVGHQREQLSAHLAQIAPTVTTVVQAEQRGTGHAVAVALSAIDRPTTDGPMTNGPITNVFGIEADARGTVVVLLGDSPLLEPSTLLALVQHHESAGAAVTMLSSIVDDPHGYGRVVRAPDDTALAVVEERDANPAERRIAEVAAGVYAFEYAFLRQAVRGLSAANAQGEQYLPELVTMSVAAGRPVQVMVASAEQTAGINDRVQLAAAAASYNRRLLERHMRAGVTVLDPATTWIDADVRLGVDVTLEPSTQLRGTTVIGAQAHIGPESTLTDTSVGERSRVHRTVAVGERIGADVTVGPFAYLRPGTELADGVHIGTYVEVKGSDIGRGSKVPHLSYVGDASIGEHTNIGAATVFVNYDGVHKHRSVIGAYARTGADNMFIAPVQVGDGAYTAAGSIITEDVPAGALGIARARQQNRPGWVSRQRPGTAADRAADRADQSELRPTDGPHPEPRELTDDQEGPPP